MNAKFVRQVIVKPSDHSPVWYWEMKALNGETLAHSEMYTTQRACIKTAKKLASALKCELTIL
jgi:uncharacterized protein YegP (UPF0339 family)